MAVFGVSAWDINVNTKIADIKMATNLHYSVRLNDSGDVGFDVNLTDAEANDVAQVLMALDGNPFKVLVTANDDQLILYSGIIWQTNKKPKSSAITFAGKALPSYFQEITIPQSYTTSIAPGTLIKNVVNDCQAVGPGANRGITPVISGFNSPPNVKPSYNKNQYTTVAQVISDQTAAVTPGTGGVDYYMSDTFVNGVPTHKMMITSPRAGRDQNSSGLSVNLMQTIDWEWPTESMGSGNHIIVVGSGTGGSQPVATSDDTAPRGGLGQPPRLELVLQYSQISDKNHLQTIAHGSVQQFGKPIATPKVTIPANYAPCALGEFMIGDDVKVWSGPSLWFPRGLSEWWRIAAYDVKVPDAGVPEVTLTLNRPPVI